MKSERIGSTERVPCDISMGRENLSPVSTMPKKPE